MLTDEEIQYVREWAASGNEPRSCSEMLRAGCRYVTVFCDDESEMLSEGGQTIAAQAEEIV